MGNNTGAWLPQISGSACQIYSLFDFLDLKLQSSAPIVVIAISKALFSNV